MKSSELFNRAKTLMPGGVSSPVRAIKPYPFYVERAAGSHLTTVDGADLIDCCLGYGPLILGHAHPEVREAIERQLEKGWLYGTPTPLELDLAGIITGDHPAVEMVRFVSSGSEATMAAIRLARGYTGKQDIIKIEGGFHGAHDAVLVKAGSGATTLGVPDSAGVLADLTAHTRQVPYNDTEALEALLAGNDDVAAFILEPVMGNVGPVLPDDGYLADVREITAAHDVLLILDEVITGYRAGIGGAEVLYDVKPDLATFGKIIGGGLPIGAFGGRCDIMELVAPAGPVYQAGTFSGNPASLAAGYATLRHLHDHPEIYRRLDDATRAIGEAAADAGKGTFVRIGSLFKHFFRDAAPRDYREVKECDTEAFSRFWKAMLEAGIFLPPSQFETNFLSAAHTTQDIKQIAEAYGSCLFA
ncbi:MULTISPECIES: glutamate-1-semialdehyde 2,1-aminomutase [Methanoculleus]|uniref:Glutamate-1-semialdehyde 2,1-aminomutase n=2 Tax=Methanoculleus TaxID=45989 RepID=GSA_METMJ|nr:MULTISPECIES: glutamate-1-semialdehyde 2,1-aminomutase [Methanoculleus]A3CU65.1 RecName: Full=Glutamate-1-semialdehyde 2,1-aminomutase; Short=GSA; AltName: Full=Glutamate-1-semialdehyde aminotransferase; Short=GSA-AT [Methanoculleus marisnigri JR1]ABN56915.1 glutamate-1-semialdehyde 2,1-aminomutase [Methanoculleus marisnigri JR1]MCC7556822.1 glutamate-1-semialdehyde 2,1-aminomutase [Methanoculleus marisnigri]UYU18342.1 glutamate-1-semialdehyde 2,1-aminomutase [Methanoculleus submarinus]